MIFENLNRENNILFEFYQYIDSFLIKESNNFNIIDKSILRKTLNYDYKKVLDYTIELKKYCKSINKYINILNIILVEASIHNLRSDFNKKNPNYFKKIFFEIAELPSDLIIQFDYYKNLNNSISKLPNILKRCWKSYFENINLSKAQQITNKKKIIYLIKISHPNSSKNIILENIINNTTNYNKNLILECNNLKKNGLKWYEIFDKMEDSFPHLIILNNIINIALESSIDELIDILEYLVMTVKKNKYNFYKYFINYQLINNNLQNKLDNEKIDLIKNALERCLIISIQNIPQINGRVGIFCDISKFNLFKNKFCDSKIISIIDSLIITLSALDGGIIILFNELYYELYEVSKNKTFIEQFTEINIIANNLNDKYSSDNNEIKDGFFNFFIELKFNEDLKKKFNINTFIIFSNINFYDFKFTLKIDEIEINNIKNLFELFIKNNKWNLFLIKVTNYDYAIKPIYKNNIIIINGWTGNEIALITYLNKKLIF